MLDAKQIIEKINNLENTDIKGSQEELDCIQTYLLQYGMSLTEKEKEYFSIN